MAEKGTIMTDETETPEIIEEAIEPEAEPQIEGEATPDTPEDDTPAFAFEGDDDADGSDTDSTVLRRLRDKQRDDAREKKEMKARIAELEAKVTPAAETAAPKPTMESCGYDEEKFESEVIAWNAKNAERDAKKAEEAVKARKMQDDWAAQVTSFEDRAKALVPNYAEQAAALSEKFGDDMNGNAAKAALIFADDPRLIAALYNSPAKLDELLALKDRPLALAVALGELKGKIRTMPRKGPPAPETVSRGGAPVDVSQDKQLERLEKEAARTGNRTALIAYKRGIKDAA